MPRKYFAVQHTIVRHEHLTMKINAVDPKEALTKARRIVEKATPGEYEPGDVVGPADPAYEVTTPDGRTARFADDGTPRTP